MKKPSFLSKLKKHLEDNIVDPDHDQAELIEAFREQVSLFVNNHLKYMRASLKEIDKKVQSFLKEHEHEGVAAQDVLSKKFEASIKLKIEGWITADDVLRSRFKKVWAAYAKVLKTTTMIEIINEELGDLEAALKEHVAEANSYGKQWTRQLNNSAIKIEDRMIKTTINWFRTLTADELRHSYKSF